MEPKELAQVISALGSEGIDAFYFYTVVNQLGGWAVFLSVVWGIRVAWK